MALSENEIENNPSLIYQELKVPASISGYVDRILYGYANHDLSYELSIPPSGGLFLSYVTGSPLNVQFSNRTYTKKPKIFIGGQLRTESPVLQPEDKFGLIGFQLHPSAFYRLFKLNAAQYTDNIADFEELFPTDHKKVINQVSKELPKGQVINCISAYIKERSANALSCDTIDEIIKDIRDESGIVRIGSIAKKFDYKPRQLRRDFLKVVGLAPKYFAKIVQLNAVFDLIKNNEKAKLNELALTCGYYDQAHFIHDFQKYLGINPMHFVKSNDLFLRTFLGRARG